MAWPLPYRPRDYPLPETSETDLLRKMQSAL